MFGFACDETPELMPSPIMPRTARQAARRGAQVGRAAVPPPRRQDPGHRRVPRTTSPCASTRSSSPRSTAPTSSTRQLQGRDHRAGGQEGRCRRSSSTTRPSTTSTRPGSSSSAGRWATAASPAARSSSTRTAAMGRHGGGAFSGKDPTQGRPQRRLLRALRGEERGRRRARASAARCRWRTPSASPSRSGVHVDTFGTGVVPDERIGKRWCGSCSTSSPRR